MSSDLVLNTKDLYIPLKILGPLSDKTYNRGDTTMRLKYQSLIILIYPIIMSCNDGGFARSGDTSYSSAEVNEAPESNVFEDAGITDSDSLLAVCNETPEDQIVKETMNIVFPERLNCSWNENGNLSERDGFVQAREKSSSVISLPEKSVLCGVKMNSKNPTLHYDDFIFLAMENNIIFGSNSSVTKKLPKKESIYQWDFQSVANQAIGNFEAPYYCIEDRSSCIIPGHDQQGPVNIDIGTKALSPIAFSLAGRTDINLDLIATGDNDEEDCMHSELSLDIEVSYLQL